MNFLNSIQSKLHGAINPNSIQYIKQQDLLVQLDPSGTAYVDHDNQSISLNVDDENTTALAILNKAPSTQPLSLNEQSQFTICLKHKVQDATNPLIGQYYINPQYDLSISSTAIGTLDTFQVNVFNASDDPVSYSITGSLTSADLSNVDLSGTLTNLYTPLSYTLRSGYGDFVFGLDGLSQQISATMYKKYWVKSVTNLLGDLVFGFSSTGSGGDYLNQPDISFGVGAKYMFDITDSTMTDLSLVFGTTVDEFSTVKESVVSRYEGMILLDISAGYTGDRLVYFEDSSSNMGYVQLVTTTTTVMNPNIFNNVTNPTFYWDFREITNNTFVTDLINGIIKANAKGNLSFNDSTGATFNSTDYIQIEPFTFGGKCSVEVYFKVTNFTAFQRVIDFGQGPNDDNFIIMSRWRDIFPTTIAFSSRNGSSSINSAGSAISADTWYHVVVTVDANTNANVIVYLNNNNDINISNVTVPNEERISNLVGRDNWDGGGYMDGQIAYVRIWQDHTLTQTEINNLYNTKDYEVFVDVDIVAESYTVDVSNNSVFRLDSGDGNGFVEKYPVTFNDNTTYIFDQSDSTNTGNTLVIGTAPDISSSIVSSGLTIMGTPGQPGAYTKYVSDGSTVYYFSYQTDNMGEEPPMYTVKVVDHEVTGEKVFSIKAPDGSFINQPDLSFGAGDRYQFDVRDSTMADISLVFGTTVDDINTVNESVVTRINDLVILDLTDYVGDRLVYFENTSAGMGYVSTGGPSNTVIESDFVNTVATTPPTNSFLNSTNNPLSFTASNVDNTFANGDYIIEASFQDSNGRLPRCINNTQSVQGYHWHGPNNYVSKSYTGTVNTEVGATTISGEWIQLTMPYRMVLKKLFLGGRVDYYQSYPGLIYMVGSNDGGTTFEIIDSSKVLSLEGVAEDTAGDIRDDNGAVNQTETTFSTTYSYSIIRMIVNELIPTQYAMPVNVGRWELTGDVVEVSPTENYIVDVSNSAFRLDSGDGNGFVEKPAIAFANNSGTTYIFDQSHESNANNTLVIGTAFDVSSSIVSSGLTIMGTPGQPGAYTKYVSDGTPVHYFSYQTENMGLAPPNITDDLYVHYDFEFPLYDPTGTERTDGLTGGNTNVRTKNKAYNSSTNSDISYNGYLSKFGDGSAHLDSTIKKIGSSSLKVYKSPVRSDNAWKLNNDQGYSICFWMKEDSASGPLFGMDNINGVPFFVIQYNSSTLTVTNNGTTLSYNISALTMTDWNHIAFTISPDGPDITWKLYINGSLVNTKTDGNYLVPQNIRSGYPVDLIFLVDVGARPGFSSYIGYFDDFRFYKTELSEAQVSAVYSYTG